MRRVTVICAACAVIVLAACGGGGGGGGGGSSAIPGGGSSGVPGPVIVGRGGAGFIGGGAYPLTIVPASGELAVMRYDLTIDGVSYPGLKSGQEVIVSTGSHNVSAAAYNDEGRLRGRFNNPSMYIDAGPNNIVLTTCIGIRDETDLVDALATNGAVGTHSIAVNDSSNLLVLQNDISRASTNAPINASNGSTVILEGGGHSITRGTATGYIINKTGAGNLTLQNVTLNGSGGGTVGQAILGITGGPATATVTLGSGAVLTGNNNTGVNGGGGAFVSAGTLVLAGGSITGNTAGNGGGVVVGGGTFKLQSGSVSGNNAIDTSGGGSGGGVYVSSGTFEMTGGSISGNTGGTNGGGVYLGGTGAPSFTMTGGSISGNSANGSATGNGGGGVYLGGSGNGHFIMSSGTIGPNNVAANAGGGVWASPSNTGEFTINGGSITGNTANGTGGFGNPIGGGGIYFNGYSFKITGGYITGNRSSACANAAGFYVYSATRGYVPSDIVSRISGNTSATGTTYQNFQFDYTGQVDVTDMPGSVVHDLPGVMLGYGW